jgi:hypothetical protein
VQHPWLAGGQGLTLPKAPRAAVERGGNSDPPLGRPKADQTPRGAATHAQQGSVGATVQWLCAKPLTTVTNTMPTNSQAI